MITIKKFLRHTVTIVKVTHSRGEITETEVPDIEAYITERTLVARDVSGVHLETKTLVFMLPDANITKQDKVIVDGVKMPVYRIDHPRFLGKTPNHLEVYLD